jgi:hypothetical protein
VPCGIDPQALIPKIAGIDDLQELCDHVDDHILVRMPEKVHFVDASILLIVLEDGIDYIFNLIGDGIHKISLLWKRVAQERGEVNQIDIA